MAKSDRVSGWTIAGLLLTILSIVFIVFASAYPYWQETIPERKSGIENIGLWTICFDEDGAPAPSWVNDAMGKRYYGCNYVFDRDLRTIVHWIFPGWFIGVTFLVTLGLLLMPISAILTIIYLLHVCSPHYEHILLGVSSLLSLLNGLLTAVAVIVFGIKSAKEQYWMPQPKSNHLSYSYGVCATVPIFCLFASTCHFVDFLKLSAQRLLNARAKVYAKGEFNNRY